MGNILRLHQMMQQPAPPVAPARRSTASLGIVLAAFFASAGVGSLLLTANWSWPHWPGERSGPGPGVPFVECVSAGQQECVIDGDTFRHGGETIRIADIDAPEVFDYGCASEKALGERAMARLLTLLNAGPIESVAAGPDEDAQGRKLRIVTRDGDSLGMMLMAEGLARPGNGARQGWC